MSVTDTWQRMRAPVLTGAAVLGACGVVYAVDPAGSGAYPPCPTKLLTGFDCPFCGSLRATHQLLHGNVGSAIDYNAMTVLVFYPVVIVLFGIWAFRRWRGEEFTVSAPNWVGALVVAGLVVFSVVRNIPGAPLGTAT